MFGSTNVMINIIINFLWLWFKLNSLWGLKDWFYGSFLLQWSLLRAVGAFFLNQTLLFQQLVLDKDFLKIKHTFMFRWDAIKHYYKQKKHSILHPSSLLSIWVKNEIIPYKQKVNSTFVQLVYHIIKASPALTAFLTLSFLFLIICDSCNSLEQKRSSE